MTDQPTSDVREDVTPSPSRFAREPRVRLPAGLVYKGTTYRDVVVDRRTGYDDEAIAGGKAGNNGAKAISMLLQRCILSIDGLVEEKRNRFVRIDKRIVEALSIPDRDFLFFAIHALGTDPKIKVSVKCPEPDCSQMNPRVLDVRDLEIVYWPDGEDLVLRDISLLDGFEVMRKQDEWTSYKDELSWHIGNGKLHEDLGGLPDHKVATSAIAACLRLPDGGTIDTETARRMYSTDRDELLRIVQEESPGVDLVSDCSCSLCGHEWSARIDPSLFFGGGAQEPTRVSKRRKSARKKKRRQLRKR